MYVNVCIGIHEHVLFFLFMYCDEHTTGEGPSAGHMEAV